MSGACELPVRESETTESAVEENTPLVAEPGEDAATEPAKRPDPEKTPDPAGRTGR
jgi:hypothetical protein